MRFFAPALALTLASLGLLSCAHPGGGGQAPATTPVRPVTEEIQGVRITDPYLWLEKSEDPEVVKWTEAQADRARAALDALPHLSEARDQLQRWSEFKSPRYGALSSHPGIIVALKLEPPRNQPILVTRTGLGADGIEKVLLDPTAIDKSMAIDFFVVSHDGKLVAVCLSQKGSELGTVRIYRTADGTELGDRIPRVNGPTAGGSLAWNHDGSGFHYTRYPAPGERAQEDLEFYQQIWFHRVGTDPAKDTYAEGKGFPRIAEIELEASEDGRRVLATVANGDGGEYSHHVLDARTGKWTTLTQFKDKITHAALGFHDDLYLVSLQGSPRGKVLRLPLATPRLSAAKVVIPQSDGAIRQVLPTPNRVYVSALVGGPTEIRVHDARGRKLGVIATPKLSDSSGIEHLTGDVIVFRNQSYVQPSAWFTYDGAPDHPGAAQPTALVGQSPVSFDDVEVRSELARSRDGTMVPMTVLLRKGTVLDGGNPTLLYAYGGYGVSMSPRFNADTHLWLEHGGVYVVANVRGGGEFGDEWHRAGNLTRKQTVFDDFIACAERLIAQGYTKPARLAARGGSNGGLLMGAVLTQRPELFGAVVANVGIYDMLHVERDPNGAFNVTEFGSTRDPAQFKALYAYSPYHHVVPGTLYPPVLLTTGAHDGRVNPYHSKKMAARLQAESGSKHPVLLRVTFDGGHGVGKSVSQRVTEEADTIAFLFHHLGVKW